MNVKTNYKVENGVYLVTSSHSIKKCELVLSVLLQQTGLIRNEKHASIACRLMTDRSTQVLSRDLKEIPSDFNWHEKQKKGEFPAATEQRECQALPRVPKKVSQTGLEGCH